MLEAELLRQPHAARDPIEEPVEDPFVQLPGTVGIGVEQGRPGRGFDAQVGQLALNALQPALDLAQRMCPAQLAEHHGDELAPAR